jgi:hypothetical protein
LGERVPVAGAGDASLGPVAPLQRSGDEALAAWVIRRREQRRGDDHE